MNATTSKRLPHERHRPFDPDTFDTYCDLISGGATTLSAAAQLGLERATLFWWAATAPPEYAQRYAQARESQAEAHADQLQHDADEVLTAAREGRATHEWVQAARVAIDAKKWAASKLRPRIYGERIDVAASVVTASVAHVELAPELRGVLRALGRNYARGIDAPAIDAAALGGAELSVEAGVQSNEAPLEGAGGAHPASTPRRRGRRATEPRIARKPATPEIFSLPNEALRVTDAELVEEKGPKRPNKITKRERVKQMSARRRKKYEENRAKLEAARKALRKKDGKF